MNIIDLQSLTQLVSGSNGYVCTDRATGQLMTEGNSFFGRLVVWVRFKTNKNYREEVLKAKRSVMASMLTDWKYGEDFQAKIEDLRTQGKLFYSDKPLSAREVHLFISEVAGTKGSKVDRAADWINWYSNKAGTIASRESFEKRSLPMIANKIKNARDFKVAGVASRAREDDQLAVVKIRTKDARDVVIADIDLKKLSADVNKAALADQSAVAKIKDSEEAQEYVAQVMSEVLDRNIAAARLKLQDELRQCLSTAGLSNAAKQMVESEIAEQTIATMTELETRVNTLVVEQIGNEFNDLLQQVQAEHSFNEGPMQLAEVKKQLLEKLAQQNQETALSVEAARRQAKQLLGQWVQAKKEALAAVQPSQFTGADKLLSRLVLQNPHISKAQIESIQQDLNQALEESYAEDKAAYELLGIDEGKFLSKLYQFSRVDGRSRDSLFNELRNLSKQADESASLFDDGNWQAADAEAAVRGWVKEIAAPHTESSSKLAALKGKIPDPIYNDLVNKVRQGRVWGPELISVANGMHIDALLDDKGQRIYELLESPQVADKRIGHRDDLADFTLNDLLKSMLGKNTTDTRKRRHAIDSVITDEVKGELLDRLERQLKMVKSRVMDEKAAMALFQRGALAFLRDIKINFEDRKMTVGNESAEFSDPQVQHETPV